MTARSGRGAVTTPFDEVIKAIRTAGYHNHRLEQHSDLVSAGIFRDLMKRCPQVATDYRSGLIERWHNVPAPGARGRRVDLFVGEPSPSGKYNARGARICVENKSVITAHRNKTIGSMISTKLCEGSIASSQKASSSLPFWSALL